MRLVLSMQIVLVLVLVVSGAAVAGGRVSVADQEMWATPIQTLSADGVPTIWPTSVNQSR